jgi:hypothetical protein
MTNTKNQNTCRLNEKTNRVSVNRTVWGATVSCTVGFLVMGFLGGLAYPHANQNILNVLVSPVAGYDAPSLHVVHDALHPVMGNAFTGQIPADMPNASRVAFILNAQHVDIVRATAAAVAFTANNATEGGGKSAKRRLVTAEGTQGKKEGKKEGTVRLLGDVSVGGDGGSRSGSSSSSGSSSGSSSSSSGDSSSGISNGRGGRGGGVWGAIGRALGRSMDYIMDYMGHAIFTGDDAVAGETAHGKRRAVAGQFVSSTRWRQFIQVCAMLFAIGIIGFGIPLYAIMMR